MEKYKKLVQIVSLLDEKHALRIFVLLAPGVLATKLASYSEPGASVRSLAAAILGAGILIYVLWGFMKKKLIGEPEAEQPDVQPTEHDTPAPVKVIPAKLHVDLMAQLVEMCNGDAAKALQLVTIEGEMHPRESYLAAIEYAHRRKTLQINRQSGS